MNYKNQNVGFRMIMVKAGLIILTAIILTIVLSGCRSTKNTSTSVDTSTELSSRYYDSLKTADSLRITKRLEEKYSELSSDISFYRSNEEALITALNELQDTISARGYLSDSLKQRIGRVIDSIRRNPCKNEVVINRDGSVRFTGEIDRLKLKLSDVHRIMDSTSQAYRDSINLVKKQLDEKIDTSVDVKTKVKKGWPLWVWLLIGYVVGVLLPPTRIFSFAKSLITKKINL